MNLAKFQKWAFVERDNWRCIQTTVFAESIDTVFDEAKATNVTNATVFDEAKATNVTNATVFDVATVFDEAKATVFTGKKTSDANIGPITVFDIQSCADAPSPLKLLEMEQNQQVYRKCTNLRWQLECKKVRKEIQQHSIQRFEKLCALFDNISLSLTNTSVDTEFVMTHFNDLVTCYLVQTN